MTTARRLRSYTYEQYLSALDGSNIKLEYLEGEIYAMAGGTPAHAQLGAKAIVLVQRGLPRECKVFSSDLKILIERADLATFPDASVVCGALGTARKDPHCATNPILLIEVTSPSTESYDRGEKLLCYQQLPSLKTVLLVSHRSRRVTVVQRSKQGWEQRDVLGGETVELSEPAIRFSVDELYDDVALDPA